jgi:hypothetical protein
MAHRGAARPDLALHDRDGERWLGQTFRLAGGIPSAACCRSWATIGEIAIDQDVASAGSNPASNAQSFTSLAGVAYPRNS